jgi:hypothetical protein
MASKKKETIEWSVELPEWDIEPTEWTVETIEWNVETTEWSIEPTEWDNTKLNKSINNQKKNNLTKPNKT